MQILQRIDIGSEIITLENSAVFQLDELHRLYYALYGVELTDKELLLLALNYRKKEVGRP